MPTTIEQIEEQRKKLAQQTKSVEQKQAVSSKFMDAVQEKLRQRAVDRGITQLSKIGGATTKELYSAPSKMREVFQGATPGVLDAETAQRRGEIAAQSRMARDLQDVREAGVQDILSSAQSGLEAETQQALTGFDLQQQIYNNMAQEQLRQQQYKQWQEEQEAAKQARAQDLAAKYASLAQSQKQWEAEMNFKKERAAEELKLEWAKTVGDGKTEPSDSMTKTASDYYSLIETMSDLKTALDSGGNVTGPMVGGWLSRQFSAKLGLGNNEKIEIRTAIDKFGQDVREDVFGSALTKQERSDAKRWLPTSSNQESFNMATLESMINQKKTELGNFLSTAGFSPEQISLYMDTGSFQTTSNSADILGIQP